MDFICFEKLVETFCRLLDFFGWLFFCETFWLASEIAKGWKVANVVPRLLKKGRSREKEEKKGWQRSVINFNYQKNNTVKLQLSTQGKNKGMSNSQCFLDAVSFS